MTNKRHSTTYIQMFFLYICFISYPAFAFTIDQQSITNGLIINTPGSWNVVEDLIFNTSNAITVSCSDVELNLNNHTIDGQMIGFTGIIVENTENNVENIKIKNGTIKNTSNDAIIVHHASNVMITDIKLENIGNIGCNITDSDSMVLQNVILFTSGGDGYFVSNTTNNIILSSCMSCSATNNGFNIQGNSYVLNNCYGYNTSQGVGIHCAGTYGTIEYSVATENEESGIVVNGRNHLLSGAISYKNGNHGFFLVHTLENSTFGSCSSYDNKEYGFYGRGKVTNKFAFNKSFNNSLGNYYLFPLEN